MATTANNNCAFTCPPFPPNSLTSNNLTCRGQQKLLRRHSQAGSEICFGRRRVTPKRTTSAAKAAAMFKHYSPVLPPIALPTELDANQHNYKLSLTLSSSDQQPTSTVLAVRERRRTLTVRRVLQLAAAADKSLCAQTSAEQQVAQVERLNIVAQNFEAFEPEENLLWSEFENLKEIDAGANSFQFEEFHRFRALERLLLSANGVCRILFTAGENLINLVTLDLSYNLLHKDTTNTFFAALSKFRNLKHLNLTGNELTSSHLKIENAQNFIEQHDASTSTALVVAAPDAAIQIPFAALVLLNLSHNLLDDDAISLLPQNLACLDLSYNNVRRLQNFPVQSMENLRHIDLSYNSLENIDDITDNFSRENLLKTLKICGNPMCAHLRRPTIAKITAAIPTTKIIFYASDLGGEAEALKTRQLVDFGKQCYGRRRGAQKHKSFKNRRFASLMDIGHQNPNQNNTTMLAQIGSQDDFDRENEEVASLLAIKSVQDLPECSELFENRSADNENPKLDTTSAQNDEESKKSSEIIPKARLLSKNFETRATAVNRNEIIQQKNALKRIFLLCKDHRVEPPTDEELGPLLGCSISSDPKLHSLTQKLRQKCLYAQRNKAANKLIRCQHDRAEKIIAAIEKLINDTHKYSVREYALETVLQYLPTSTRQQVAVVTHDLARHVTGGSVMRKSPELAAVLGETYNEEDVDDRDVLKNTVETEKANQLLDFERRFERLTNFANTFAQRSIADVIGRARDVKKQLELAINRRKQQEEKAKKRKQARLVEKSIINDPKISPLPVTPQKDRRFEHIEMPDTCAIISEVEEFHGVKLSPFEIEWLKKLHKTKQFECGGVDEETLQKHVRRVKEAEERLTRGKTLPPVIPAKPVENIKPVIRVTTEDHDELYARSFDQLDDIIQRLSAAEPVAERQPSPKRAKSPLLSASSAARSKTSTKTVDSINHVLMGRPLRGYSMGPTTAPGALDASGRPVRSRKRHRKRVPERYADRVLRFICTYDYLQHQHDQQSPIQAVTPPSAGGETAAPNPVRQSDDKTRNSRITNN